MKITRQVYSNTNRTKLSRAKSIVSSKYIDDIDDEWEEIESKRVKDSGGWWTDYTMYFNHDDGRYVFVFGDKDFYRPEDGEYDWECENADEAWEWFDSYTGFDDEDDINSCITASEDSSNNIDATYVVRKMHELFPEIDFIDERDAGDNVRLYFRYTSKFSGNNEYKLVSWLDSLGLEYHVRDGKVVVIAPEDSEYSVDGCEKIEASSEYFDKGDGAEYWYFTTHGVMPGSVPRGLDILDVVDRPEGSYFKTNKVLTSDALKYYDIKERSPR